MALALEDGSLEWPGYMALALEDGSSEWPGYMALALEDGPHSPHTSTHQSGQYRANLLLWIYI